LPLDAAREAAEKPTRLVNVDVVRLQVALRIVERNIMRRSRRSGCVRIIEDSRHACELETEYRVEPSRK